MRLNYCQRFEVIKRLPDAQLPLAVPPLATHSLPVKQVPFITLVAVDIAKIHWLNC